jgi:serine/threonine protein kinase
MVDWWSLGVLMVEILQGKSPFSKVTAETEENRTVEEIILNDSPNLSENIDGNTKDIILKLLEKDPSKRLGFQNDAEDLKNHPFFESIDWIKMKNKLYTTPKKPLLKHRYDVSRFDCEFTNEKPPFDSPKKLPNLKNADKYFRGYSYYPHAENSNKPVVVEVLYQLQLVVSSWNEIVTSFIFHHFCIKFTVFAILSKV